MDSPFLGLRFLVENGSSFGGWWLRQDDDDLAWLVQWSTTAGMGCGGVRPRGE